MVRQSERAVDWSLIEGATARRPRRAERRPGTLQQLLLLAQTLPRNTSLFEFALQALTGVRTLLGLDRVSLYVLGESGHWWQGVVGTDAHGHLVDERPLRHGVDAGHRTLIADYLAGRRAYELLEDAPWMGHGAERSEVLGRGWFAQAPILWAGKGLAMLYCDSALAKRPFDPVRQEQLVTFGALLAEPLALARERAFDRRHRGLTPSLRVVLELLDADPELDTSTLARRAGLPPRALGQLCAQQLGQSLVQTRNEHRLARFFRELEAGRQAGKPTPLLELALRSGFGSYAQFHRVFTCTLGAPPKVYLQEPTAPAVPRAISVKSEK